MIKSLKKPNIWFRLKDKFALFLIKRLRVKSGPLMIEFRGNWYFIDFRGNIWLIQYTDYDDIPLRLTKWGTIL